MPFQHISDVKVAFEQRSLSERHYILELAWWLIEKYPRKINEAIKHKKLRHLLSDNYGGRSSDNYLGRLI